MNNTIFPLVNYDYMVSDHKVLICPKKAIFLEISEQNARIAGKLLRRLFSATIISCQQLHNKDRRLLLCPPKEKSPASDHQRSVRAFLSLRAVPLVPHRHMKPPPVTSFFFLVCLSSTKLPRHMLPLSEACNRDFQRILCPTTLFF